MKPCTLGNGIVHHDAMEALNAARAAWENSQPQLFLELEDAGLSDTHGRAFTTGVGVGNPVVCVAEPAALPRCPTAGSQMVGNRAGTGDAPMAQSPGAPRGTRSHAGLPTNSPTTTGAAPPFSVAEVRPQEVTL